MKKIVLVSTLLLAGCLPTKQGYRELVDTWIGASDQQLVQRLGAPTATYKTGDRTILTYDQKDAIYVPPTAPTYHTTYSPYTNSATTTAIGGTSGYSINYDCKTNFTIYKHKVESVSFSGSGCEAVPKKRKKG